MPTGRSRAHRRRRPAASCCWPAARRAGPAPPGAARRAPPRTPPWARRPAPPAARDVVARGPRPSTAGPPRYVATTPRAFAGLARWPALAAAADLLREPGPAAARALPLRRRPGDVSRRRRLPGGRRPAHATRRVRRTAGHLARTGSASCRRGTAGPAPALLGHRPRWEAATTSTSSPGTRDHRIGHVRRHVGDPRARPSASSAGGAVDRAGVEDAEHAGAVADVDGSGSHGCGLDAVRGLPVRVGGQSPAGPSPPCGAA